MKITTTTAGAVEVLRVDHPHGGCTLVAHAPGYEAVMELDAAGLARWRDRRRERLNEQAKRS